MSGAYSTEPVISQKLVLFSNICYLQINHSLASSQWISHSILWNISQDSFFFSTGSNHTVWKLFWKNLTLTYPFLCGPTLILMRYPVYFILIVIELNIIHILV